MNFKTVGHSEIRVDAMAKVTGEATYPEDFYMKDMLWGKTLRSTKAHAHVNLDTQDAEKMEGVIKVFTYRDVPDNHHGVVLKDHEVFCSKKVRRIGDPLAFVVATSNKIAEKALKAIKVEYNEIPAIFDPVEAMMKDAPLVHENHKSNIVFHYKLRRGNIEEAFKECAVIIEKQYRCGMVDHGFLQPEAGLAYMDGDTVVVCAATQYPHFDQLEVAEALHISQEKVRIINPAVGGAFGGREDITMQVHLALATKVLGRPIKTVYSREESFLAHSKRHPMVMTYKTGADANGKLLAMEAELVGDTGAYASWAINVMRKAGVHATGPYEIPNVKVDSYAVYTNNPFAGAMRGFGATQVPIAHEQQMDMIAEKLNIDPITIRLINGFTLGSTTATGQVLSDSVPLKECIEAVENSLGIKNHYEEKMEELAMEAGVGI